MTTLFRSRQRAEAFAARVDGTGPVRPLAGGTTDASVERLVGVTQVLRLHAADDPAAVPRDAFASDLRERLMAEAASVLVPGNAGLALPVRTRGKRERRLVAVASAAVLLGGTAGMATAAQSALPGEALYPVKRGIEKAEYSLSMSSAGRGRDLLHQANDRLGEAQALVDQGPVSGSPQVPRTLAAFTSQAEDGSDLLLASYADSRDPHTIAAVREFAATALESLTALDATAPAAARPDLQDAAAALRDIDARATRLCDTCSDLPALTLPKLLLAGAEVDRALHQAAAAGLDNSHPFVADRRALRAVEGRAPRQTDAGGSDGGQAGSTTPNAPQAPTTDAPLPGLTVGPTPEVKIKVDLGGSTLAEGLGDAVETIVPDATDLLP